MERTDSNATPESMLREACLGDADVAILPFVLASLERLRALADVGVRGTDLVSLASRIGSEMAAGGASPTLAMVVADRIGASGEAAMASSLRAAFGEGLVRRAVERREEAIAATFDFDAAATELDAGWFAFAAHFPFDDHVWITEWASRVAATASRRGVRRATVSGREVTRRALEDALDFAGVEVARDGSDGRRPWDVIWTWFSTRSRRP
ncbi:MAG: hypothetical protein U0169_13890 [Polyangiaceae bacterium]